MAASGFSFTRSRRRRTQVTTRKAKGGTLVSTPNSSGTRITTRFVRG